MRAAGAIAATLCYSAAALCCSAAALCCSAAALCCSAAALCCSAAGPLRCRRLEDGDACCTAAVRLVKNPKECAAFSPLRRLLGVLSVFFASGVMHEVLFWCALPTGSPLICRASGFRLVCERRDAQGALLVRAPHFAA